MKTLSILLVMFFSLQGQASSEGLKALSSAFDQYHYAMQVEWDQKDQSVFDHNNKVFSEEIKTLMASHVLSLDEIQQFLASKVTDQSELESIQLKAQSFESLDAFLKASSEFSMKGASWDGANQTLISIGAGIFLIGFVYWAALDAQQKL